MDGFQVGLVCRSHHLWIGPGVHELAGQQGLVLFPELPRR
jgi:hypothetical protein